MAPIDTKAREKWPAPEPGPGPAATAEQVALARREAPTDPCAPRRGRCWPCCGRSMASRPGPSSNPLALIEVMLSHRTADPQTWAAYQALRRPLAHLGGPARRAAGRRCQAAIHGHDLAGAESAAHQARAAPDQRRAGQLGPANSSTTCTGRGERLADQPGGRRAEVGGLRAAVRLPPPGAAGGYPCPPGQPAPGPDRPEGDRRPGARGAAGALARPR